jgi:predicted esterase
LALLGALCGLSACSQYIDPKVPEPIRPFVEPEFSSEYLLYRPSQYNREFRWPLIVINHGGFPDSPLRRMRVWTQLAESNGFIVAAPRLDSARSGRITNDKTARKRLAGDERRILSVVQHVRAAHNISEDRIFLYGFDEGIMATLLAGAKHPDVFRAIAVSRPTFRTELVDDAGDVLDHDQPILVHHTISDAVTGGHAARCIEWLRSRGANLNEDLHGAMIEAAPDRIVNYFREIVRSQPWIRVRALPTGRGNPLEIRFQLKTTLPLSRFEWDFGDGGTASSSEPVHAYARPGRYRVLMEAEDAEGKRHRRAVTLKVPEAVVAHVDDSTERPQP